MNIPELWSPWWGLCRTIFMDSQLQAKVLHMTKSGSELLSLHTLHFAVIPDAQVISQVL